MTDGRLGPRETVTYRGHVFGRYPQALRRDQRVYFHSGARGYLHRVIWADLHGPIPPDHEIHYADHDTDNLAPANLVCVPRPARPGGELPRSRVESLECTTCGATFTAQGGTVGESRFCSLRCQRAHYRRTGRYLIDRDCPVCGVTYSTDKYRPTTYCSNRCHAARRVRSPDGTWAAPTVADV